VKPVRAPLTVASARALFAYNRAVFDRFVAAVERLPTKTAHRARGIGHRSLFDTLVHVLNVHEVWIGYILPGQVRQVAALFREPGRHPKEWAGFHLYEARVWAHVDAYLAGLTEQELRRTVRAPWMPGRYVVADALLQTTFEEAHHLGEIIGALWQDDREPPDMTWIDVGRRPARTRARR
jgi:uncharacterized damage-inducible protein DinB